MNKEADKTFSQSSLDCWYGVSWLVIRHCTWFVLTGFFKCVIGVCLKSFIGHMIIYTWSISHWWKWRFKASVMLVNVGMFEAGHDTTISFPCYNVGNQLGYLIWILLHVQITCSQEISGLSRRCRDRLCLKW